MTECCVSAVMAAFDEEATLEAAATRVLASPRCAELIIVDDGSRDRTLEIAKKLEAVDDRVLVLEQGYNQGKGAALRRGIALATAPIVVVQDADLEYDPADYEVLIGPILDDKADVVYGSRFTSADPHRVLYFWHSVGNKVLTTISNIAHQPQSDRHRNVLQGVPARGDPVDPTRRGPLRLRARSDRQGGDASACASTRSASRTQVGHTAKARRSAGVTACEPSCAP